MLSLANRFTYGGDFVAWGAMGSGPPLVLVHGTPFSSQVWRRIAPHLARHWRVYFFDLIGYGQSQMRAGQDVSLGVQNGLLAALLQEWGIATPEVLCHDFGGATVLRAYYLNGLRYRRVTLIDPVALAPWGSPFVTHVRQYEQAFAGLPATRTRRCCVFICRVRHTARSARRPLAPTSRPGRVLKGRPVSTGRSRRWSRRSPMKSNRGTRRSPAR